MPCYKVLKYQEEVETHIFPLPGSNDRAIETVTKMILLTAFAFRVSTS